MWKILAAVVASTVLAGCASLNTLASDVTSYSQWPADRKPGTYAFERLPSQQSQPEAQARLEDAARRALEGAGFTEVAGGGTPEYTVQLGARVTRYDRSPWDDPFWRPYGAFGWWGPRGPYWGWGLRYDVAPRYDREVAVLIRDRKSGTPLYESRAANESGASADTATLAAMFEAALKDFPQPAVNPRRVSVQLSK